MFIDSSILAYQVFDREEGRFELILYESEILLKLAKDDRVYQNSFTIEFFNNSFCSTRFKLKEYYAILSDGLNDLNQDIRRKEYISSFKICTNTDSSCIFLFYTYSANGYTDKKINLSLFSKPPNPIDMDRLISIKNRLSEGK